MARHAMVDISQVFGSRPKRDIPDRLPPEKLQALRAALAAEGVTVCNSPTMEARLTELRGMYEPYVATLAEFLMMDLPDWMPKPGAKDSWKTGVGSLIH